MLKVCKFLGRHTYISIYPELNLDIKEISSLILSLLEAFLLRNSSFALVNAVEMSAS